MSESPRARLRQVAIIRCRKLRARQTQAETRLWVALRARRFHGLKFRRQHPIMHDLEGPEAFFIVDFYCHEHALVIEVDGGVHDLREEEDERRDFLLSLKGYRVLHVSNEAVLCDLDSVLRHILEYLHMS